MDLAKGAQIHKNGMEVRIMSGGLGQFDLKRGALYISLFLKMADVMLQTCLCMYCTSTSVAVHLCKKQDGIFTGSLEHLHAYIMLTKEYIGHLRWQIYSIK